MPKVFYSLSVRICAAVLALAAVACSSPPDASAPRASVDARSYTLSQRKLLDIVDEQKHFFERIRGQSRMNSSDAISIKARLDSLWAEYLAEFPDDVEALIIYGKYLRALGNDETAYATFSRVDRLDPNIAVVKQQLANHESENAMPRDAYRDMCRAVELEPDNCVYLLQLAQLIVFFREELIFRKVADQKTLDGQMSYCYARAARLEPLNSEIQWKYAQSFYDLGKPDWNAALRQWQIVLRDFSPLNIDRQTALANKARVLTELRRDEEALEILREIDLPALEPDKLKIIAIIQNSENLKSRKK